MQQVELPIRVIVALYAVLLLTVADSLSAYAQASKEAPGRLNTLATKVAKL